MSPYAVAHNKYISNVCEDCVYVHTICLGMKKRNGTMPDFFYIKKLLSQNECSYCHYTLQYAKKHIDHIIPVKRGGSNDNSNLCISCSWCNEQKHTMTGDEYRAYLDKHPEELQKRNLQNAKEYLSQRAEIKTVITQKKEIIKIGKCYDEMKAEDGFVYNKRGTIIGYKEGYKNYKEKEVVKTVKSYLYMNKEAKVLEFLNKIKEGEYDFLSTV